MRRPNREYPAQIPWPRQRHFSLLFSFFALGAPKQAVRSNFFVRQAVGAYRIRPPDVPEREQMQAFGFHHPILADRLEGVCDTPLQWGEIFSLSFSFSFLDERKGGKRKSRRQGRRPIFPSPGRGRQGRRPIFPSPGRGRQGRRPIFFHPRQASRRSLVP